MSFKIDLTLTLNGRPARAEVAPNTSTLEMLRDDFDLAGAKLACGEGECGACTVLIDGVSVTACLMPAVDCDGRTVETVEGVMAEGVMAGGMTAGGMTAGGLDPIQRALVAHGAVQCGYCTPGIVMQAKYLLARDPTPSEETIRRGLEGNTCRCTGYSKIVDAIAAAGKEMAEDMAARGEGR